MKQIGRREWRTARERHFKGRGACALPSAGGKMSSERHLFACTSVSERKRHSSDVVFVLSVFNSSYGQTENIRMIFAHLFPLKTVSHFIVINREKFQRIQNSNDPSRNMAVVCFWTNRQGFSCPHPDRVSRRLVGWRGIWLVYFHEISGEVDINCCFYNFEISTCPSKTLKIKSDETEKW